MIDEQKKELFREVFNAVAEGYGKGGMKFFHRAAAHLPEIFQLRGDEHLLDVATGTGIAVSAIAPCLPHGKVTGLDLSEGMLGQAKINNHANTNTEFHIGDMTQIPFPDQTFNAANCSFGIFFVEDMAALMKHLRSKVKPGGRIVTCSFAMDSFKPLVDLFLNRIQSYGVELPEFSWKRVGDETLYRALYQNAGLSAIEVHLRDVSYFLKNYDEWWDIVWWAGFRALVAQLSDEQLARFKREHAAEVAHLATEPGIPLNIKIVYGVGRV